MPPKRVKLTEQGGSVTRAVRSAIREFEESRKPKLSKAAREELRNAQKMVRAIPSIEAALEEERLAVIGGIQERENLQELIEAQGSAAEAAQEAREAIGELGEAQDEVELDAARQAAAAARETFGQIVRRLVETGRLPASALTELQENLARLEHVELAAAKSRLTALQSKTLLDEVKAAAEATSTEVAKITPAIDRADQRAQTSARDLTKALNRLSGGNSLQDVKKALKDVQAQLAANPAAPPSGQAPIVPASASSAGPAPPQSGPTASQGAPQSGQAPPSSAQPQSGPTATAAPPPPLPADFAADFTTRFLQKTGSGNAKKIAERWIKQNPAAWSNALAELQTNAVAYNVLIRGKAPKGGATLPAEQEVAKALLNPDVRAYADAVVTQFPQDSEFRKKLQQMVIGATAGTLAAQAPVPAGPVSNSAQPNLGPPLAQQLPPAPQGGLFSTPGNSRPSTPTQTGQAGSGLNLLADQLADPGVRMSDKRGQALEKVKALLAAAAEAGPGKEAEEALDTASELGALLRERGMISALELAKIAAAIAALQ